MLLDLGVADEEGLVLVGMGLLAAVGGELVGYLREGEDVVLAQGFEREVVGADAREESLDVGEWGGL